MLTNDVVSFVQPGPGESSISKSDSFVIENAETLYRLKIIACINTVKLRWLEHLQNHESMFEPGVVRANEC